MASGGPLEPSVQPDPLTAERSDTTPAERSGAMAEGPGDAAATGSVALAETILGHHFARPDLLSEALTHRSALAQRPAGVKAGVRGAGSNERLEFVGDRVLGLLVAEWLAERFPAEQEGDLGRRLAHLVAQPVLAGVAEQIGLAAALQVAPGEVRAGVKRLSTVLADAMEAVIGALYLDGGIAPARAFVRRAWDAAMQAQPAPPKDAKTALQEWAQARGLELPDYQITTRAGPPHAPIFTITVAVGGQTGSGTAGAKRSAEQAAATDLLGKLAS
jgi:ribonuclease-3